MPEKADMDPLLFPQCLPKVWLYRYLPDEQDFECRLIGQEVVDAWKLRQMRGQRLSAIAGDRFFSTIFQRWSRVVELPVMLHSYTVESPRFAAVERVALPLAGDGAGYVIGITQYRTDSRKDPTSDPEDEFVEYFDLTRL